MTRQDVIKKAVEGSINWIQAADILSVSPRHVRRLRERYEQRGIAGLRDGRADWARPRRIPAAVAEEICRLKREVYPDFSTRHFHEFATERHGLKVSYSWTKEILQMQGLAVKSAGRGKHRRKRERRPMVGMLLHLDASTHPWIEGVKEQDLVVMMDDADGRILFARFVEQEGSLSTLVALKHVLVRWGRFSELYTDRGSHFCRTGKAGNLELQLPASKVRISFAKCPVLVHEFLDGALGVSFHGQVLARFDRSGLVLTKERRAGKAA